ncbi:PP2C family protein-serine/threonine phosphatase [Streptomyces sp. NPDC001407]|uniref:PP2C family protein-serine/threonine phosphatase n=1 Tax=Streptomyces sp. NPDC001407 TaxID=3364573 RepID=UPI00367C7C84
MTTTCARVITVARATRKGTREHNADAAAVHVYPVADVTAAAVVDGIGNDPEVVAAARIAAEVAVRVGARKGGLAGLLAAAELYADPGADPVEPDAVAVLALAEPGQETRVHWIGDCRAWGFDGRRLRQYTIDHTMGEHLRQKGASLAEAALHDNWVRTSLGTATVGTVNFTEVPDPLVILTSDGVHDALDRDVLDGLIHAHPDSPQALADALVRAAQADTSGYRDDATAVVLLHHT